MTKIEQVIIRSSNLINNQRFKIERERAILDLTQDSYVEIEGLKGPYSIEVEIIDHKFACYILAKTTRSAIELTFPLSAIRKIIKDYSIVCESYFQAIQFADTSKVEAIDIGRRALHNEGAEILRDLLPTHIKMDFTTLRKVFTLIYVLVLK